MSELLYGGDMAAELIKVFWPFLLAGLLIFVFLVNTGYYLISSELEYRRAMKLIVRSDKRHG